jgi:predicted RNA-binding Zn ribbon-like protein
MTEAVHSATERYGIAFAPGALALVQDFVNTKSIGSTSPDLLDDLESANAWLAAVDHHGTPPTLVTRDLRRLRTVRTEMEALIAGNGSAAGGPADARFDLDDDGRPVLSPSGAGWKWVRAALLCDVHVALLSDTWPRLRLCRNPGCQAAFYDRSKNNSAVWHDLKMCGNAINLRASRARRRATGGG